MHHHKRLLGFKHGNRSSFPVCLVLDKRDICLFWVGLVQPSQILLKFLYLSLLEQIGFRRSTSCSSCCKSGWQFGCLEQSCINLRGLFIPMKNVGDCNFQTQGFFLGPCLFLLFLMLPVAVAVRMVFRIPHFRFLLAVRLCCLRHQFGLLLFFYQVL